MVAWLVPKDFDISTLSAVAERRAVEALLDNLGREWLVLPHVTFIDKSWNAEVDVILASKKYGAFLIEVKGGVISMRDGSWYTYETKLRKSPFDQLASVKHNLVKRMAASNVDLNGIILTELVAMPDMSNLPATGFGPGAPRENLLDKDDLQNPAAVLERFAHGREEPSDDRFLRFIRALRPTVEISRFGGDYHQTSLHRIDDATRTRLNALVALADNQRFLVTGAAGTGKTFLAEQWARRCVDRGERTLLVCYNRPLGDDLVRKLDGSGVSTGSFHQFAMRLLTPLGYSVPAGADAAWWDTEPARLIVERAADITDRFDAIIIDEGQDFRPAWMEALYALHDPSGAKRLLMVADPMQAIYSGPWSPPTDMPSLPLLANVRSSALVAKHVEGLGGVGPNPGAPDGPPVRRRSATYESLQSVLKLEISTLVSDYGIPPSQIVVLARHRKLRDAILLFDMPVPLCRWEDRSEEAVVCETIHRVKGLERPAVVLVDMDKERSQELEYIGSSRAILHLTVVGQH